LRKRALLSVFSPHSGDAFMDKILSIFSWPVGLLLCFGPVLVIWLKAEFKESRSDNPIDKQIYNNKSDAQD
jgi:hypothetical protein